ncbi:MAG: sulfatase [Alphaproteobacteria bacterium]|nr:sulfatase [Alphaproteobacteria bacterium]
MKHRSPRGGLRALCLLVGGVFACSGSGGAPKGAAPLLREQVGQPIALARQLDDVIELALPASSRPGGVTTPEEALIQGPFKLVRVIEGVRVYEAPIPIRPRSLFFFKPLPGMEIAGPGGKRLRFQRSADKVPANTWSFTADTVLLRLPADAEGPEDGQYTLRYPRATERERSLNLQESGLSDKAFAGRSLQLGADTRTGLLLPAPAIATWTVTLPPAATLQLDGVILPPELDVGERSDGATLVVEVAEGERVHEAHRQDLTVGDWTPMRVDLSAWAGREVKLTLRTDPGDSATMDYVFLAEPTVYTPTTRPRKLLLVFLDTLRYDHLSLYGYARETTPKLDAWAEGAAVFEAARSVAPWTLPSTRAALSGDQPERWGQVPHLAERLAEAGWATGAFVGNVYLSSNFDMAQGWSQHGCVNWPLAEAQVERVRDFVGRHEGRDVAVMLHTMDTHLPYTEPLRYRSLWAGDAPAGLDDRTTRSPILKAAHGKDRDAVRDWLIARYDQNLRYLDDQVAALIEEMGPDTTVVLFADHGEEFWDHGDFEHGHTLYDELLRVPFIVAGPGVTPGRHSAPVSLLDLTPTVLDLLGVEADGFDGVSLAPLLAGQPTPDALTRRAQAFGRPLYGDERWGALVGDTKWITHNGRQQVFDLGSDPGERDDLVRSTTPEQLDALRAAMGQALQQEAPLSWRLDFANPARTPGQPVVVELHHPDGLRAAWMGADPLMSADMDIEGPDEAGVVRVTFNPGSRGTREVYVVPEGDPAAIEGLTLTEGTASRTVEAPSDPNLLFRGSVGSRHVTITWGFAPLPGGGRELEAMDPELEEALRQLGYHE